DLLGLPTRNTVRSGRGNVLYDVSLTRNAWAGLTTATDHDGVGLDHQASFSYDPFARLTRAKLAEFEFEYEYDELQNMVAQKAKGPRELGLFVGTYRYGQDSAGPRQLTSIVGAGGASEHRFAYDKAGRLVVSDTIKLLYDAQDQLIQVDGAS